jgi:hypothetical protein
LRREEIQKMLNLDDVDLKQTQFYKDVFEEVMSARRRLVLPCFFLASSSPFTRSVRRCLDNRQGVLLDGEGPCSCHRNDVSIAKSLTTWGGGLHGHSLIT